MIICIPKETNLQETRVAATPEVVQKYVAAGHVLQVEHNAGLASGFLDKDYQNAGAQITKEPYAKAEAVLKIWAPTEQELKKIPDNAKIIANFSKTNNLAAFANRNLSCFALEQIPRISKAQSMDILSSQSNLSGYKAVIEAFNLLPRTAPLLMTSAGTAQPAKVLIIGIGVAGLQAIATAKRLGALVYAADIRAEAQEQALSLGAKIIQTPDIETQLSQTDVLITAALPVGKTPPKLISLKQLAQMPISSVAFDLAAGNIEGAKEGQSQNIGGVTLVANSNLAAKLPFTASRFFAQNVFNFMALEFNFAEEIIRQTCLIKDGKIYQKEAN